MYIICGIYPSTVINVDSSTHRSQVEAEELSQKITRIQAALALSSLKPRAPARVRPTGQGDGLSGILANL